MITGFGQQPFPWWGPAEEPVLPTQQLLPLTKLGYATGWGAWLRNVGSIPKRFTVVVTCAPVVVDQS